MRNSPGRLRYFALVIMAVSFTAMVISGRWFSFLEDETSIVTSARRPARATVALFTSGKGEHEHPPLSDLLVHCFLPVAGHSPDLLRLPFILLYFSGLMILGCCARRMAGPAAFSSVVIIGALSPLAFHLARLVGWYTVSFFLTALLTLLWLRYVEEPTTVRLTWWALVALALVYTNYFGWVLIGCFFVDAIILRRRDLMRSLLTVVGAIVILYLPLWPTFLSTVTSSGSAQSNLRSRFLLGMYDAYVLFVSESVAPWFWLLSVPAAIGIAVAGYALWSGVTGSVRRFLLYFAIAYLGMILSGAIETKRLLFVSTWLLLSIACALALVTPSRRRVAIISLTIAGIIGWAGIFARRWYAAQHFIEPWSEVAAQMAPQIQKGTVLVTNSPSLLFYLNYDLPAANGSSFEAGRIVNSRVMAPIAFSRLVSLPAAPVTFVKGVDPHGSRNLERVAKRLAAECEQLDSKGLVPDNGTALKARLFPSLRQPAFRITVTNYRCPAPQRY